MDKWWQPSIDWQEFQNFLSKQMPFVDNDLNVEGIEKFVKETVNSIPKTMMHQTDHYPITSSSLHYKIFETHRSIFVRYRVPADVLPKSIKILANRRKLKIRHSDSSEEISLPSDVKVSRTVARIHDGILEIRMPKSKESEPFREIFIDNGAHE